MEIPAEFVGFIAQYNNSEDLIENLFLKALITSYSRVKNIYNISSFSENQIRNEFQFDLTYSNELIKDIIEKGFVTFTAENQIITKEKELKRTDIQFLINGIIKYVVECKKLRGINRSQYIDNGLSRFINHIYISSNEKYAGMCSFIIGDNKEKIISGTKDRIKKFHFISLNENTICDFDNSFSSIHKKEDKNNILIYHLFFDMKQKEK